MTLKEISIETLNRHRDAFDSPEILEFVFRRAVSDSIVNVLPMAALTSITSLQHAVRSKSPDSYEKFSEQINNQDERFGNFNRFV